MRSREFAQGAMGSYLQTRRTNFFEHFVRGYFRGVHTTEAAKNVGVKVDCKDRVIGRIL